MDHSPPARGLTYFLAVGLLAVTALCSSAAACFGVVNALRVKPAERPPAPVVNVTNKRSSQLPPGSYPTEPLAAGTPAPLMQAAGWLNGDPQQPGEEGSPLIVLDIWSHWCPVCRQTAPGLVRLQEKFADQPVAFVSLTDVSEYQVQSFVDEFDISWPCGYGAGLKGISRFGAYNPARAPGNYNLGYEVTPTLYVIGPDGRVLWHDAQARPQHTKNSDALIRELEAELERLLSVG